MVDEQGDRCVKCRSGSVLTVQYGSGGYTNVWPEMGRELVRHPRDVFFGGDCVAYGDDVFNEGTGFEGRGPVENCLLYRVRSENVIDCVRCRDYYTGEVDNGVVLNCSLDADFERGVKRYGLDPVWEKLFSSYVCRDSGKIPFVAYIEKSDSDATPKSLQGFNPANQPYNGTLRKSTFCSLSTSDETKNQSTQIPENCGMGAYRIKSTANNKNDVQFICAACKPGYKPTFSPNKNFIKTTCTKIQNCIGTKWYNSCSECSPSHSYNFTSSTIDYTTCIPHPKNPNCLSASNTETCKICKKGFSLNTDNYCDSLTPPNCKSSLSFNTEPLLPYHSQPNLKAYIFYKMQDNIGCGLCKEGYTLVEVEEEGIESYFCSESEYIKTQGYLLPWGELGIYSVLSRVCV